jgi:hypothetical protein
LVAVWEKLGLPLTGPVNIGAAATPEPVAVTRVAVTRSGG